MTDNTTDGVAIDNNGTCLILGDCQIQNVTYTGIGYPSAIENSNLLKVGINGSLTIQDVEFTAINNYAIMNNNGSINLQEFQAHGISNNDIFNNKGSIIIDSSYPGADVGINSSGTFTNNEEGTISISNMPLYGFNVFSLNGILYNYGQIDIFSAGIINIEDPLNFGIDNNNIFENNGRTQVYYSDGYGVYNEGHLNNIGTLIIIGSSVAALTNSVDGIALNSGSLTISDSSEGVNNSGLFTNQEEGFCSFSSTFNNHYHAFNLGVWVNFVDLAYPNNPGSLFVNYGIMEDRYDVFPSSFLNQQIIIRRLSDPLQAGVPFANPIEIFSNTNFDIATDWELSILGGFAGSYDESSNTFIPDAAAVGATQLIIPIEMVSTGFIRNYTLKLDSPIAAFKTNDKPQFSFNQQADEIQLFPNPAVDRLTFVKNDNDVATFTTYSNSGKKLASQTFTIQR